MKGSSWPFVWRFPARMLKRTPPPRFQRGGVFHCARFAQKRNTTGFCDGYSAHGVTRRCASVHGPSRHGQHAAHQTTSGTAAMGCNNSTLGSFPVIWRTLPGRQATHLGEPQAQTRGGGGGESGTQIRVWRRRVMMRPPFSLSFQKRCGGANRSPRSRPEACRDTHPRLGQAAHRPPPWRQVVRCRRQPAFFADE